MIIELSDFFNNPSLIDLGPLKIQYYAVTWLLSALLIYAFLKKNNSYVLKASYLEFINAGKSCPSCTPCSRYFVVLVLPLYGGRISVITPSFNKIYLRSSLSLILLIFFYRQFLL